MEMMVAAGEVIGLLGKENVYRWNHGNHSIVYSFTISCSSIQ